MEVHYYIHNSPSPVPTLAKSIHSSARHTFDRRRFFPSWSGQGLISTPVLTHGKRKCSKTSSRKSRELKSGTPFLSLRCRHQARPSVYGHCCRTKLRLLLGEGNFRVSELWQSWWRKKLSELANKSPSHFTRAAMQCCLAGGSPV